jgi:hypothetical protein
MNITIFKGSELADSVSSNLQERMATPIYGVFAISWAIFHWEFIYTAIFVNQQTIFQKTHMLKNDYLTVTFFDFSSYHFYVLLVLPFLITWLIIWHGPRYIGLPAFRKAEEYKNAKTKISIEEEKKIQQAETRLQEKKTETLAATEERVKKERNLKSIDPAVLWEEEYKKFKRLKLYKQFSFVIDAVYLHAGKVKDDWDNYEYQFEIPRDILVYCDANEIIALNNERSTATVKFTEKGRYFVNAYTTDTNSSPPL